MRREHGGAKDDAQLLPKHTLTSHSSETTRHRNTLDQITDGQLWQQSQKGSAAPTKGYSSSLQSPAASVTHSHCPNRL